MDDIELLKEACYKLTAELRIERMHNTELRKRNAELSSQNASMRWHCDEIKEAAEVIQTAKERLGDMIL